MSQTKRRVCFTSTTNNNVSPVFYSFDRKNLVSGYDLVTDSSLRHEVRAETTEIDSNISYKVYDGTICFGSFNREEGITGKEGLSMFVCGDSKFVGFVEFSNGSIGSTIVFLDLLGNESCPIVIPVKKFIESINVAELNSNEEIHSFIENMLNNVEPVERVRVGIDGGSYVIDVEEKFYRIKSIKEVWQVLEFEEVFKVQHVLMKSGFNWLGVVNVCDSFESLNCDESLNELLEVEKYKLYIGDKHFNVLKVFGVQGFVTYLPIQDVNKLLVEHYSILCNHSNRLYKVSKGDKEYYVLEKDVLVPSYICNAIGNIDISVYDVVYDVVNVKDSNERYFMYKSDKEEYQKFFSNDVEYVYWVD